MALLSTPFVNIDPLLLMKILSFGFAVLYVFLPLLGCNIVVQAVEQILLVAVTVMGEERAATITLKSYK